MIRPRKLEKIRLSTEVSTDRIMGRKAGHNYEVNYHEEFAERAGVLTHQPGRNSRKTSDLKCLLSLCLEGALSGSLQR